MTDFKRTLPVHAQPSRVRFVIVPLYVRFQSAVPNRHGQFPGVFALANGLASDGRLSTPDYEWWRAANDQANLAYVDPSTVAPQTFDSELNPGACAWFKSSATELLAMSQGYLNLLSRYEVPWVELHTDWPGRVVYEDEVQVVAVPLRFPADWPFAERAP